MVLFVALPYSSLNASTGLTRLIRLAGMYIPGMTMISINIMVIIMAKATVKATPPT